MRTTSAPPSVLKPSAAPHRDGGARPKYYQRGRYDDEFGSATFDRASTGSQGAEGPDEVAQVRGSLDVAILQA